MSECDKTKHKTKEAAKAAIIQSSHFYKTGASLGVYVCNECGFWHITSGFTHED